MQKHFCVLMPQGQKNKTALSIQLQPKKTGIYYEEIFSLVRVFGGDVTDCTIELS